MRFLMLVAATILSAVFSNVETARAETRSLKLHHLHSGEKATIAFWKDGRYLSGGRKQIDRLLRDWRTGQSVKMDPRLLDLVWETYRRSGSNGFISVIGGYRSPATNKMLRSRSSGVARHSQHTLGKAMDLQIPGVPLRKLREIGLKLQVGGVGYYPKSGSPFLHLDVGQARYWPRMKRTQLMALFPKGDTVYLPSDGRPLPRYREALAAYSKNRFVGIDPQDGGGEARRETTLLALLLDGDGDEARQARTRSAASALVTPATLRSFPRPRPDAAWAPAESSAASPSLPRERPSPIEESAGMLASLPVPTPSPVRPVSLAADAAGEKSLFSERVSLAGPVAAARDEIAALIGSSPASSSGRRDGRLSALLGNPDARSMRQPFFASNRSRLWMIARPADGLASGFEPREAAPRLRRFEGSAVWFLPVARSDAGAPLAILARR